jgi:hypothetical protein
LHIVDRLEEMAYELVQQKKKKEEDEEEKKKQGHGTANATPAAAAPVGQRD